MPGPVARYEDAWRNQTFAPDTDRFTVETPPDPDHGSYDRESNAVIMMDAPVLQGGGEIYSDAIIEPFDVAPVPVEIDRTPIDGAGTGRQTAATKGHGYGGISRPIPSTNNPLNVDSSYVDYGRQELGAFRGRDVGADERATHEYGRPWKFFTDKFFGTFTEGLNSVPLASDAGGDIVLRRGLNSYLENNGSSGRPRAWTVNSPSWRTGWYFGSNIQRDFSPPNRTHGHPRFNQPNIVTIIGDAPPPEKSDKYANPFSSLQKFLPKRRRISGLRRVPGPWDDAEVANAVETSVPTGNADGLVIP